MLLRHQAHPARRSDPENLPNPATAATERCAVSSPSRVSGFSAFRSISDKQEERRFILLEQHCGIQNDIQPLLHGHVPLCVTGSSRPSRTCGEMRFPHPASDPRANRPLRLKQFDLLLGYAFVDDPLSHARGKVVTILACR